MLTIVWSEACDLGVGGSDGLTLNASGGAVTLDSLSGEGTDTWAYTLSRNIYPSETLTLDHTNPGDGIEDSAAGNDLANFSGSAITNNSTFDDIAPTYSVSPAVDSETANTVTFAATAGDEFASQVDHYAGVYAAGSTPTAANVKAGSGTGFVAGDSELAINNDAEATFDAIPGLTANTSYRGAFTVEEQGGGNLAAVVYVDFTTDPDVALISARVINGGDSLRMVFNRAVSFGAGGNGGFALTMSGGAVTISSPTGTGTTTLTWDTSRTIASTETGTLAYTQPGDGVEAEGDDLATFSDFTVDADSTTCAGVLRAALSQALTSALKQPICAN